MNKTSIALIIACLSACASQQEEVDTNDPAQAVRDFIAVRELSELDKMRTSNNDHWTELDAKFIIYETRREAYLVEFMRPCHELLETRVVPDVRREGSTVRPRFDTIRGCHIDKIFALTEGEVAELNTLGESPGSRN